MSVDEYSRRFVNRHRLCRLESVGGNTGPAHLRRAGATERRRLTPMNRQLLCGRIDSVIDEEGDFNPRRDLVNICPECRAVYEHEARLFHGQAATGRLVF